MPIITDDVSSFELCLGEYFIQHYVKSLLVVCDMSVVSPDTSLSSTNNTNRHDITEILLKVALSTIT